MTYKVGQSKPERAASVFPVILSARLSARVRTPFFQVTKKVAKKSLGDTGGCVPLIPSQRFKCREQETATAPRDNRKYGEVNV